MVSIVGFGQKEQNLPYLRKKAAEVSQNFDLFSGNTAGFPKNRGKSQESRAIFRPADHTPEGLILKTAMNLNRRSQRTEREHFKAKHPFTG